MSLGAVTDIWKYLSGAAALVLSSCEAVNSYLSPGQSESARQHNYSFKNTRDVATMRTGST